MVETQATGTARDTDGGLFDPAAIGQRVAYLAHAVVGHFSRTERNHPGVTFDTRSISKLQDVATAWHGAEMLDKDAFRDRFLDPGTSDETVERLRAAMQLAAKARTQQDLAAATRGLALAMSTIGLDRWRGFLNRIDNRAVTATNRPAR